MIELFQFESCPFCAKVRRKLEELDVEYMAIPCHAGSKNRARLRELGGKEQVPFLVDTETGTKMYESDDIIAYLEEQYAS